MSPADSTPAPPPTVLSRPPVFRPGLAGWLLFGTIMLGSFLRVRAASPGSLWRDEAHFLFVARLEPFGKLLKFLRLHESHPPGFYLLMRSWSELFGRSESAAVGLSLVFGVMLIPIVYFVGSRLFGWRVGLFASALTALSPPLIQLSILVRPYALLAVLSVFSAYLLWECLRGGSPRTWLLYGATVVLTLYVHNWMLLVYGAQGLIGSAWLVTRERELRARVLRPWILTQISIVLCYAPWVRVLKYQFEHAGHGPSPNTSISPYLTAAKTLAGGRLTYVVPLMLLALLAGAIAWRRSGRRLPWIAAVGLAPGILAGIPLIVILIAAVLSGKTALLPPWCVAVLAPLVILLLARMLAWVHETGAWREAYVAGGGLLLLYGVTWFSDPEGLKSNARMTAAVISERAAPGDLIIVTPETLASSFNYYFRRKNQQIDYPSLEREQVVRYDDRFERMTSEGALQRALARIDSARARGRRVWFVMEASDMADRFVRPLEPADTARDYLQPLVLKRSNQLRQHLVSLYGPPKLTVKPAPGEVGLELLGALLFAPSSAESASLAGRTPCQIILPAAGSKDTVPSPPLPQLCLR